MHGLLCGSYARKGGGCVRVLLMDTCGETGSVALAEASTIVAAAELPARAASSALLANVRKLMEQAGWTLASLAGVGVANGPGSFTGVRVGLAAAKGLCESRGLPLAAVSRLQVLAETAGLERGYAVLDAGRGEVYVRRVSGSEGARESLYGVEELLANAKGQRVVLAEQRLLESLATLQPELHGLHAKAALPAVLRSLAAGGDDLGGTDANYVRSEQQIYGKASNAAQRDAAT